MNSEYAIDIKALPLIIDTVTVPGLPGAIGISSCPGMKMFSTLDLYDDRIENDLQSIRSWGASVIVTLLESYEISLLGLTELSDKALSLNLHWIHLPIRNMELPDKAFEESWQSVGPELLKLLIDGQRILIHCKEGVGRSGVVAARLLIESGVDPETAMKVVRKARPGTLMLNSHEAYCLSLADSAVPDNSSSRCYAMPRPVSG